METISIKLLLLLAPHEIKDANDVNALSILDGEKILDISQLCFFN